MNEPIRGDHVNESEIVARARQGSDEAWVQIVQLHQEAIFRLAYLILGNAEDAEDVTQEAFMRAHDSFERFTPDRPLRPWLLRIGRNLAYNRRRSLRRYWLAVNRFLANAAPAKVASPESRNEAQADADGLWRAVGRLRRPDQEVIYLRYFLGLSTAETAAALSVAEGTAKSRLSRALDRLRQSVESHGPEPKNAWPQ